MRLKTLMEEKHLDFNQPLLTVRRLSSTPEIQERRNPENSAAKLPPLPFYRSELKSGPMSKPGTVPFIWEKAPGRPKSRAVTALPNHAPKLPPGRFTQIPIPDKDSDSVPETSSCSENDDESYLDALDTFSRSESCFIDSPESSRRFSSEQPGRDFMMGRFLLAAKAVASEAVPARKPHGPKEQPRPIPVRVAVNGEKRVADIVVCDEIYSDEIEDLYDDSPAKLCGLLPRFCVLNPVPGLKVQVGRTHSVRTRIGRSPYGGSGSDLGSKSRGRDGRTLEGSNLYKRLNGNGGFPTKNAVPPTTDNYLRHSQLEVAKEPEKGNESKNFLELLASEGSEWGSGSMSPVVEKTLYVVSEPKTNESNQQTRPDTSKITEPKRDICEESAITESGFMIPPPLPKTVKHSDLEPKTDESSQQSRPDTSKIPEPERDICEESAITESGFMIPPPLMKKDESTDFMILPPLPKAVKHSDSEPKTNESNQQTRPDTSKITELERDICEESAITESSFTIPPHLPETHESTDLMILPSLPKIVKHSDSEPKTDESSQQSRPDALRIPEPERDLCEESAITESSFTIPPHFPETHESTDFMILPHLPKIVKHSDSKPKTDESSQQSRPDTSKITEPSFMIPPPLPKTPSDSWLSRALDSKKSAPRTFIGSNVLDRTVVCKTVDGSKWETIVKTSKAYHGHLRFSEELLLPPIAEV